MSGDGTFAGTNYQAGVIAYVAVTILDETPLRWLPAQDDAPSAVSGEVKGPGDDARIEFKPGDAPVEIQAKRGLTPQKAVEAVQAMVAAMPPEGMTTILAVDSTSSASIHNEFRKDLDRLRSGRRDGLSPFTDRVLAALGASDASALRHLHVRLVDVDQATDREAGRALDLLQDMLERPTDAATAWAILQQDAARMCADKTRRIRSDLQRLLSAAGLSCRPPRRTRKWHDALGHSKRLLDHDEPENAMAVLRLVEAEMRAAHGDADSWYRLNQQKAAAELYRGNTSEALRLAQAALDAKPDGLHALVVAANAQVVLGQQSVAVQTAERAIAVFPDEPIAWVMRVRVAAADEPAVTVPPHVAATAAYRKGLIQIQLFRNEYAAAARVAADLIGEGDAGPEVRLYRVDALLSDIDTVEGHVRVERAAEIERRCDEILAAPGVPEKMSHKALLARSAARRVLGKTTEAEEDVERVRAAQPDDAQAILVAAQAKIRAGKNREALELVEASAAREPMIRALRARMLSGSGDQAGARRDLDVVLQAIPQSAQPDILRSAAAEVALALDDVPLARRLLDEQSSSFHNSPHRLLLEARLKVVEGDLDGAESTYRRLTTVEPGLRDEWLSEAGSERLRAGDAKGAVRLFAEAAKRAPRAERAYVRALIQTNDLVGAQGVLRGIADRGQTDDWAIAAAAEIAERRDDPVAVAALLEDLLTRGPATASVRLKLIQTWVDLEQPEQAKPHLVGLQDSELTARERMNLAQLLLLLGESERAVAVAFRAYRQGPHDPDINRAFVAVVLRSKTAPAQPDVVDGDVHVRVAGANRPGRPEETREFLVLAEVAEHRLPNEISIAEAAKVGLKGLRSGDAFVQDQGTWSQTEWRVVEIQSAERFVFNDVLSNFGTRFLGEEALALRLQVDPGRPSLGDFAPVIASTQHRE